MSCINKSQFELLPHTPQSPDLAPPDYFFLPNLKNDTMEDGEVESAVNFEKLDGSCYKQDIEATAHRWEKLF